MNRILLFVAAVGMALSASAQDVKLVPFNVGNDSFVNGMSINGKWATFQRQAGEETVTFDVQLVDLSTGQFVSYTPAKMYNYRGLEVSFPEGSYSQPFGVSADGKIVYGCVNGYPAYFTVDDLTWHHLSMGSAVDNRNLSGAVYGMSADGTVMAGWFAGVDLTTLRSALWVNGEIRTLPNLPTYKDMYDKGIIDRDDYYSQADMTPNYTFRTISEDGTKMVVGIDHNRPQWGCSYGIYDLTNETFTFILPTLDSSKYGFTDSAYMSSNGEWVTGNMNFLGADKMGADDHDAIYRYHVPSGKLEVYKDLQSRDLLATAIDNNGTIFAATPASQPMRNLVVRSENLWVDLGKILDQKYNINFYNTTGYDNSGYAINVSSDCKTLLSQAEFRGGAFALTLPVDFAKAAEGTSLLTEYVVSPTSGKKFSRLNQVMVRFSYNVVPTEGAKAVVTDESGNVVGESTAFNSFSSQNILYSIVFPDITLKEGEIYTVTVPAGSFIVPGTSMGNPEIKVNYYGRENIPVKQIAVSPEADSYINVFSMNNPVTIDFDNDLSVSTAVQAKLYEEGKDAPLCNLSVSVVNKRMVVYPASERRLAKDRVYRIEIPAGIVSDLSGMGANDTFSIKYNGAYVPNPVEDPARPFFEDFSEPNEALYHFLLIDGDGNNPTEEMQSFGFDANNTPWNFSVRDEGSYDYCGASHSLYSPSGKSDDWMFIPQIHLNDADYYLTFKAQSYLKDKTDNLRIVVWEYDDVLGSMDAETLEKVKAEAKTLKEIRIIPSQTEGVLAGSWTEYEIPLAEYAGKNVYIGFVNENYNQSIIFVDDIAVEYRGAYNLSVASEENVMAVDKTDIYAYINVNAVGPFDELKVELNVPSVDYTTTETLDNLALTTGSRQIIEFKDVPLKAGEVNKFTVTSTLGGLSQTYAGSIINHAFEINRRVLIEEGTGMWCGNCPKGEAALEHLEETMPDNISVISVHNGDVLVLSDYDQMLALGGYPGGRIDRIDNVYLPMIADPVIGDLEFTSASGDQTFKDIVISELSKPTEGEIKVVDATLFSADEIISVPVDVRFSVTRNNALYNIFTCVLEDGLPGIQTNYFVGNSSQNLAWWAAQPMKVEYTYNNVARAMIGGFYGLSGRIPTSVIAGETYHSDLKFEVPSNINNLENMHFVVALVDATSGRVINSDVCRVFAINDTPGANVDNISDDVVNILVTVVNGKILVNGEADGQVYTANGMRVNNSNLSSGIYIVRKVMEDGTAFSKLVMVK